MLILFASIPFYPQNFNVELIATWSDGDSTTYGTDVAVTPDNWVYILTADYSGSSHYFYVLDGRHFPDSGFHLVNTVYDSVNYISALTLWKDYLYAQTGYGVSVYDISDRANPRFIRRVVPPGKEGEREGEKGIGTRRLILLFLPEDTLLLSNGGYLWSLQKPDSPSYLSRIVGAHHAFLYPYLYSFLGGNNRVYDISDPKNPRLVFEDTTGFNLIGALAIYQDSAGNYFLAQGDFWTNQIGIYSLENPERPEPVGIVDNPFDCTEKMVVHNNRVYATTWNLVVFQGGMDSSHIVGFYYLGPGHVDEVKWANGYVFLTKDDLVVLRYLGDTSETEPELKVWFSKGSLFFYSPEGLGVNLKLYDLRGSLLFEEKFGVPKGTLQKPLNLPSRGMYFALVEREDTGERKVVKCWGY